MDHRTGPTAVEELARLLRGASQALDRAITTHLGEASIGRWHVLCAVVGDGERAQGRSMSQLAEATLLTGASLTRLIDAMIAENLVHRRVDDTDRRRVLVLPTARGLHTHRTMAAAVDVSGLDRLATARLTRTLTTLSGDLNAPRRAHV
ncbi:MarR family transcriptional regulator [Nocardia takedensis]|uniref:MarR family winged helix-turn-helix transcriptional regulator n=1 Tax=Nocardia takedensis TaxID=259390 RepID=UPI000593E0C5|nr:MarR family winged helix-turn-helix transcriptional regulator [Nocardia takedensis]